jgi:hypothetical protein
MRGNGNELLVLNMLPGAAAKLVIDLIKEGYVRTFYRLESNEFPKVYGSNYEQHAISLNIPKIKRDLEGLENTFEISISGNLLAWNHGRYIHFKEITLDLFEVKIYPHNLNQSQIRIVSNAFKYFAYLGEDIFCKQLISRLQEYDEELQKKDPDNNRQNKKRKKPGRPHLKEDIWVWEQIHIHGANPKKVYPEWVEKTKAARRYLEDPKRHFNRIKQFDWR